MYKTLYKAILIFFAFSISTSYGAKMLTGSLADKGINGVYIQLEGAIKTMDGEKFKSVIARNWRINRVPVVAVFLNSPGGNVQEAYVIANLVRTYHMGTYVYDDKLCASACFSILAAGEVRFASPKSIVGVHRASTADGDSDYAKSASFNMIQAYETLHVPQSITLKMIETPPNGIYYLTKKDKKDFNTNR